MPLIPTCCCRHYKNPKHQRRVRSAWTVAGDCDLLLFLVDAQRELHRPDPRIARMLTESTSSAGLGLPDSWQPPPALLVLNKVDAVPRPERPNLLPLADRLRELRQFEDVFFVSAKDGEPGWLVGWLAGWLAAWRQLRGLTHPRMRRQQCQ